MYKDFHDTILETYELLDPAEYIKRRDRGEINSKDVEIVMPRMGGPIEAKFKVKLKEPRYVVRLGEMRAR